MPGRRQVVVTQNFFDEKAIAYLQANNCDVSLPRLPTGQADGALSHDELFEIVSGADGWIVGHARVTRELLASLPRLKVLSRRGVGYDRVDFQAAKDLGMVVAIAVGGNEGAVAELTIGLMLAVSRRIVESQEQMKAGNWAILQGTDLSRKTIGIIGLGRIGRTLIQKLKGFEARFLVATPNPDQAFAEANNVTYVDTQTLLRESDYVSLHAPLTPATRFVINEASIRTMKPTAIVVNTARGGLVEDAHLLAALKEGRLGGAALDVFMSEGDPAYKQTTEELIRLPNVVATPHAGASSRESLDLTNMIASQSLVAVLDGGSPPAARVVADGRPPKAIRA
jgi:D-3-phosphoglycerate dehydrogenase